jgi:exonuclease III
LWAKNQHKLVIGSIRESSTRGHFIGGVYKIGNSTQKAVVIGVYGVSDNDDNKSLSILQELDTTIEELQFQFNAQHVFVAGDFNAIRSLDDTTSNRIAKPKTNELFNLLIAKFHFNDLGLSLGKGQHTWRRPNHENQTSRLDYFLTTVNPKNSKFRLMKSASDHDLLCIATSLSPSEKHTQVVQDHVLSMDEFLVRSLQIFEG